MHQTIFMENHRPVNMPVCTQIKDGQWNCPMVVHIPSRNGKNFVSDMAIVAWLVGAVMSR